jgi:hypothetical protein
LHTKIRILQTYNLEKTTHITLCTKVLQEKNNFILENISMYNPQRDKVLSTSKKEVKNGGTKS